MTESLRVAIYSRVSTEDQSGEDKVSLTEQVSVMTERCSQMGWTVEARYQDIASGTSRKRADFQRMLADARAGRFDCLMSWSQDRFGRGIYYAIDLLEVVEALDLGLEDRSGPINRTALMFLAVAGKVEIDAIRARSKMGKIGRAKMGRIPCGSPPYGYRTGPNGRPEIDEEQAPAIRTLFALYTSPKKFSVPHILKVLQSEYGYSLTRGHLYNILSMTAYVGTWTFEGIEVPTPRIISDATFAKAQRTKRDKLTRAPAGSTKPTYLLEGLLRCTGCGRRLVARTRRERRGASGIQVNRYYRCTGYTPNCRPRPYIQASALENMIWGEITTILERPDVLLSRFTEQSEHSSSLSEDIQVAEAEVQKWNRKSERLISLFVSGAIDRSQFDHQQKYIQEPLEAAQARLDVLRHRQSQEASSTSLAERFLVHAFQFQDSLEGMSAEDKRDLLHEVIDSATIDEENHLRYQLRVPAPAKVKAGPVEATQDGFSMMSDADRASLASDTAWPDRINLSAPSAGT